MKNLSKQHLIIFTLCLLAFILQAGFSMKARPIHAAWANVPPAPTQESAGALAMGDAQLAYRIFGLMIQNLGDIGGNTTPLNKYNYPRLGEWFLLEDKLDMRSNFIPYLAAYYFGGTQNPQDLDPVIDYLAMVGQRPYEEKWRWLAQAVYLERFRKGNMEKGMELANQLAALWKPGMPGWAKQMPAFVAVQQGDKQAAYAIMMATLREEGPKMKREEVNFMVGYICERLLDRTEAAKDPLCTPAP